VLESGAVKYYVIFHNIIYLARKKMSIPEDKKTVLFIRRAPDQFKIIIWRAPRPVGACPTQPFNAVRILKAKTPRLADGAFEKWTRLRPS
jgi:hypothetical protein